MKCPAVNQVLRRYVCSIYFCPFQKQGKSMINFEGDGYQPICLYEGNIPPECVDSDLVKKINGALEELKVNN